MRSLQHWLSATEGAVAALRDEEGRPLREGAAPVDVRGETELEMRTCQYPGSRRGHAKPMNVSALRQMKAHWKDLLGALGWLRTTYVAHCGRERFDVDELWRFTTYVESVVPYVMLRADGRVEDGKLPAYLAAVYKVVLGVTAAVWRLGVEQTMFGAGVADVVADADRLYAYTEEQGLLVGRLEVCAGPENMIREMLAVLIGGIEGGGDDPRTRALVGDTGRLAAYAAVRANHRVLVGLFNLCAATQINDAGLAPSAGSMPELLPEVALFAMLNDETRALVMERSASLVRADEDGDLARATALLPTLVQRGAPAADFATKYRAIEAAFAPIAAALRRGAAAALRRDELLVDPPFEPPVTWGRELLAAAP